MMLASSPANRYNNLDVITWRHFSGHETFPLRYTWLKKGVDATTANPHIFCAEDAHVQLGVGKNMVRAIRHWGLATGVLQEELGSRGRSIVPSALGTALLANDGWDPYLEDPATLWLIHWRLAAVPGRASTWYWLFNHHGAPDFTVDGLVDGLVRLARESAWAKVTPSSLRRDVDCCVRTYVADRKTPRCAPESNLDFPLRELCLVRAGLNKGTYVLSREARPSLPWRLFGFALQEFMQSRAERSLSLDDLMYQPGAPGRVFGLDEDGLTRLVDGLGAVTYDETAGLKYVRLAPEFNAETLLQDMYAARPMQRNVA